MKKNSVQKKSQLFLAVALFAGMGIHAQAGMAAQTQLSQSRNALDMFTYLQAHIHAPAAPSSPGVPKYNRLKHFGAWVNQDSSNSCHNTREMVLAKEDDESVAVEFSANGCTITAGLWHEPYTGADVRSAAALQIDHVVPLAQAYYSGAYAWTGPERCHYANYLGNNFHLRAVSGHENMSKGDKGPDGYLPPNHDDRCSYVSDWMKIKIIWQLNVTPAEFAAIQKVFRSENCAEEYHVMEADELSAQRAVAAEPIPACAHFGESAVAE